MATHDFGILLGLAYQGFVDQLHVDLERRGFTDLGPAHGYVIRAIADEPNIRQRDLARRLGITEQGIGKIITVMERGRYITRRPDRADGRAHVLVLAPRGQRLLAAARRFHAALETDLRRKHGDAVSAMRRVLDAIVAASADDTAQGRLRAT
jgi:MarR family transcriptional regulator for hemolysin